MQSAILYMDETPQTDNDDDHLQTHPAEKSTGNIQLAAAVLLLLLFSILLHYCDVCRRVIYRGEYSSYERTYFGSASTTKGLHTVPCIACGRSDTITTRTMVT